jgi:hypothetical protein
MGFVKGVYNLSQIMFKLFKSTISIRKTIRPGLHYTGLHRSGAIFIPGFMQLLFTLRHSNPVRDAEQKSLRFGGDMKSNPVCAGAVLNRPIRDAVLACMF